ncbi:hypothetical protein KH5H1_08040 [Corallococcus caeni]|uniref:hypothetical protein n=1 Tax=Corallococcus caeni TaxID=3082388 RepID=UPI002957CA4C|nr:hypothetical protein KH5H1_08040 [Corallococcus sp. KH5-1]
MAKKKETNEAPVPAAVAPSQGESSISPDSENLFESIKASLTNKHKDKELLLNIPIWGWTGDGKTVALLTTHYFLDVFKHGLGLALVTNTSALQKMEAESAIYRGLNLAAAAATTKTRLTPLIERFIEGGEWPPGTDEGVPYLFDLRTILGTVGYLLMPDLRGGSFREGDEQAREVLRTAHACIILVRPDQLTAQTSDGKRYRDAVVGQVQDCAALGIPTSVMLTQSDKYPDANPAADEAHNRLSVLLSEHRTFPNSLSRVSVIGKATDSGALPPIGERNPESILRPMAWAVWQALKRPKEAIHASIPPLSLQSAELAGSLTANPVAAELRVVSEQSNAPGFVATASSTDHKSVSFTFIKATGDIFESEIPTAQNTEPRIQKRGKLVDFDIDPFEFEIQTKVHAGTITTGLRSNADWIWHGSRGGNISKASLPTTLTSWTPTGPGQIIGIDSSGSGRIGSFRLTNGKWQMVDHIGGFIDQTPVTELGYLPQTSLIVAMNGKHSEGVSLRGDGTFGDRIPAPLAFTYDTTQTTLNEAGMGVTISSTNILTAIAAGKIFTIPKVAGDIDSIAVASSAPVFSVVLPDMRLLTAKFMAGTWISTESAYSPLLEEMPTSMQWSPNGRILVATFEAERWTVYRPFGLGAN